MLALGKRSKDVKPKGGQALAYHDELLERVQQAGEKQAGNFDKFSDEARLARVREREKSERESQPLSPILARRKMAQESESREGAISKRPRLAQAGVVNTRPPVAPKKRAFQRRG